MGKTMKCPYCNCIINKVDYCEYCGKPLSASAKKAYDASSNNFDTSRYNHQHIKQDSRNNTQEFNHITVKSNSNKQAASSNNKQNKTVVTVVVLAFIVFWFAFIIISIIATSR